MELNLKPEVACVVCKEGHSAREMVEQTAEDSEIPPNDDEVGTDHAGKLEQDTTNGQPRELACRSNHACQTHEKAEQKEDRSPGWPVSS